LKNQKWEKIYSVLRSRFSVLSERCGDHGKWLWISNMSHWRHWRITKYDWVFRHCRTLTVSTDQLRDPRVPIQVCSIEVILQRLALFPSPNQTAFWEQLSSSMLAESEIARQATSISKQKNREVSIIHLYSQPSHDFDFHRTQYGEQWVTCKL